MRHALRALVAACLAASTALAHLMPAQQGTINVLDNAAFVVLSLPLSAMLGNDDNGDGRLSPSEVARHATTMQADVARRVRLYDGDIAARADFVQVSADADERDPQSLTGGRHFIVLMRAGFDAPPRALRIDANLWGTAANEQQLTIKATRGGTSEAAVLSPRRHTHQFFSAPGAVFRDYVVVGFQHIAFGADHLMFLLTIIVAAAGWRYWLGVLTTFTVAHSITLTLSLAGFIRVSPTIAEPLIAASIVLMAVLNLRERAAAPARRIATVFSCGLVHGLGFASSIADMGLDHTNKVMSVVGFNVGIEIGQALCVTALLATTWALYRAAGGSGRAAQVSAFAVPLRAARLASVSAALVGAFWLVERLGIS